MNSKRFALVTGAASGIGAATVRAFTAAGWEIIGVDRDLKEGVQVVDVSSAQEVEDLFGKIDKPIHALVNNAAIQPTNALIDTDLDEWDTVLAINLRSVYLTARYAYPQLKQGAGAIVNVSSVHAIATSLGVAAYAASKGAVLSLTRAMALEMAPDGIRVNAVLPGAVDTPMLRSGMDRWTEAGMEQLAGRTPLGRIGTADEIAQAILFLADNERSSFITGQALIADGGATARLSTE